MPRLTFPTFLLLAVLCLAAASYKVTAHWPIGGEGGWDYVYVDSDAHRLYVSHATKAVVLDSDSGKILGEIPDTPGIHGIAVVPKVGLGFTSNGKDNSVSVFDLKTLTLRRKIKVGANPDAIQFEPLSNVLVTFNGTSKDATVISVEGLAVLNNIPLGAKPEFSAADGKGNIWVNLEDRNSLVKMSGSPLRVANTWPLGGCEEPSGLAFDAKNRRIFSVCSNKVMTVLDADSGKQLAKLPIGAGADGVAFDPIGMNALASNGADGTVTVVHESSPDKFAVTGTVPTMKGARTIGIDTTTGRAFLPAKSASFEILVLSR